MVKEKAKFSLVLFLTLVFGVVSAQKKLIQSFDTSSVFQNSYLNDKGEPVAIGLVKLNEKVDINDFDWERVEAGVLFALNQWRNKGQKHSLEVNTSLQTIASGYVTKYGKSRFDNSATNAQRSKLFLKKVPRYMDLNFTYVEGGVGAVNVVDYNRTQYFYSTKYTGSEIDLFAGSKSKVDSLHPPIPLYLKTYQQLIDDILQQLTRGRYARYIKNKAYDLVGISVRPASYSTKRINQVKFMVLVGGYRNKYLLKLE